MFLYPIFYAGYKYGFGESMTEMYLFNTPLDILMKHRFISLSGFFFMSIGIISRTIN